MFDASWSLVMTVVFLATAVLCGLHLARSARPVTPLSGSAAHAAHSGPVATTVHVNHLVMSLAMLLMVWRPVGSAGTWAQVAIFGLFALLMLMGLPTLPGVLARVGLLSHVVLNASMIWMLLAMPLLMGHAEHGGTDEHAAHHAGAETAAAVAVLPVPAWATTVNAAAMALSALVALWWLGRLLRESEHRAHSACHLLMGGGMALMLALM